MKHGMDLHLHLDGSLTAAYMIEQAKKQGIQLPTWEEGELLSYLKAPENCKDLNEYLKKFDLPCLVLQTEEALTCAVADLCQRLKAQGLSYAEIRFAPQPHLQKGLSQRQVVRAAVEGLVCGEGFEARLILCCMRGAGNEAENLETIRIAAEYLGKGVAAADLAGAEALFATEQFAGVFQEAVNLHVPFTIHAGEAVGAESIWAALRLGAKRIGHGVRCLEDESLVEYLREQQIPLEVCLTSNLQTKAVKGVHPLGKMLEAGLCVTLNTDNMTVSDTTLEKEFQSAKEMFGWSEAQLRTLKENAAKAKFKE